MPANANIAASAVVALLVAACGSVNLDILSFNPSGPTEVTQRGPANATEYRCDDGKRFHVRMLESGAAWLIAPDREIRLERVAASPGRYSTGNVVLEISGPTATLTDPPAVFSGCKAPAPG